MKSYIKLFNRDLDKLSQELESFKDERNLWETAGDIENTAGNLALHLIGNLNHFIGAVIGESGFVRNREAEFSDKNIPLEELRKRINETKSVVEESLANMTKSKLTEIYPIDVFGDKMTYEFFLIHLVGHLNYHLGQINYLRRIAQF